MSIYNNIDGVNKEVSQPYVNIDGAWKEVDLEYTNIDGTWKTVFEKTKKYKINLYRYGELYTTLECAQGSSIQLITVPTVQSDDVAHYGWTKTAGSTSRNYATTATITPTADMNLYAVFSYTKTTITYTTTLVTDTAKTFTVPMAGEITIGGSVRTASSGPSGNTLNNADITLNSNATAPYCKVGTSYVSGTSAKEAFYSDYSNQIYLYKVVTKTVTAGTSITILGSNQTSGGGYMEPSVNIAKYVGVKYPSKQSTSTAYRSKI